LELQLPAADCPSPSWSLGDETLELGLDSASSARRFQSSRLAVSRSTSSRSAALSSSRMPVRSSASERSPFVYTAR
jgi:hypothetical protein